MMTFKIKRTGRPALAFTGIKLASLVLAILVFSLSSCDFNGNDGGTGGVVYPIDDGTPPSTTPPPGASTPTCQCTSDLYACSDFLIREEAQACYDYCVGQGKGDLHRLDEDGDKVACE